MSTSMGTTGGGGSVAPRQTKGGSKIRTYGVTAPVCVFRVRVYTQ